VSSALPSGFIEWLDEMPCSPEGFLVQAARGETRIVPHAEALAEWRTRNRPRRGFPRRERRQNQVKLLGYLIEREEER
jgi:hypothetical protein